MIESELRHTIARLLVLLGDLGCDGQALYELDHQLCELLAELQDDEPLDPEGV